MAFKFMLVTLTILAVGGTHAGVIGPITYSAPVAVAKLANPAVDAVASTHQNVVRSYGGTVSTYSKAIDTPYSSVRKEDTRISNNVYTPAIAKTVAYAAAAPVPTAATTIYTAAHHHEAEHTAPPAVYEHNQEHPTVHVYEQQQQHQEPAAHIYSTHGHEAYQPTVTKTVSYAAAPEPIVHQHQHQQQVYQQQHQNYHQQLQHQHAPAVATTTYNHGPDASTYSHNAPGIAAYGTNQIVRYSPAEMVSHMSFDGFGTHWGF